MKFKEAMNGPDSNKWKEEIENEHTRMVTNSIWKPLDKKDLLEGAKVITSTVGDDVLTSNILFNDIWVMRVSLT